MVFVICSESRPFGVDCSHLKERQNILGIIYRCRGEKYIKDNVKKHMPKTDLSLSSVLGSCRKVVKLLFLATPFLFDGKLFHRVIGQ